jgi:signal transduction histidine kinase
MKSHTTKPDRLPWWRYIGPWPLRPVAMGIVTTLATLTTSAALITIDNFTLTFLSAAITGFATFTYLWLAERLLPHLAATLPGYLLIVSTASALVSSLRWLTGTFVYYEAVGSIGNGVFSVLRTLPVALIILAIFGSISGRLQDQLDDLQEALATIRAQSDALLAADETTRQQVAQLLHDRVQAGLIGVCLQLQQVAQRVNKTEGAALDRIVESLENIRALDVRRAVRALSPNLRDMDLDAALRDLAEVYEPGMATEIDVALEDGVPYETRLGVYRIIEQALLNSAAHGRATRCTVRIHCVDDVLHLEVVDNGQGLAPTISTGMGTTLTSTWCRTLGGDWSRSSKPGGGVHLQAELPCHR